MVELLKQWLQLIECSRCLPKKFQQTPLIKTIKCYGGSATNSSKYSRFVSNRTQFYQYISSLRALL